jgi:hypothetical protein
MLLLLVPAGTAAVAAAGLVLHLTIKARGARQVCGEARVHAHQAEHICSSKLPRNAAFWLVRK